MKKVIFALAAILTAVTASAAEGGPMIGVGARVGTQTVILDRFSGIPNILPGTTSITVPINVAPGIRVEPFVGFARFKTTNSTNPAGDVIDTQTEFDLGAGVYLTKEAAQNVEIYGGGKIELNLISLKSEVPGGSASDSFTGFGIAAVGGAEYYFSPRFALGIEAELGLHTVEIVTDIRQTDITTATFVTAKVFFK